MKLLFVGPSLHGVAFDPGDVAIHGPVEMGDIERAVAAGALAIGIVDGHYQQIGAVWHKEILFALAAGVTIFGAASMGALRAAECEAFGMVPVGAIATRYCTGELFDDADVALTNAPAELGFAPLTEPIVDIEATLAHLQAHHLVTDAESDAIRSAARAIFFADRTIDAIFAALGGSRAGALRALYLTHRISQKAADALELLATMKAFSRTERTAPPDWRFARSPFWNDRVTPVHLP